MNFGEQIKNIRLKEKLTQEQMAEKLCVSRQAVSNWENNKNLPDIEMLITISEVFQVSLDELIFKGEDRNNIAEKIIKDGSETRRTKMNLTIIGIGMALILMGIACIFLKAVSVDYIDATGILHENFFLLPMAAISILCGFLMVFTSGMRSLVAILKGQDREHKKMFHVLVAISAIVCLAVIGMFLLLLWANS